MAKKRARQSHSGSVYQDRGSWFAAVMVNGKRRKARCSSKAEANAVRVELCRLAEAGAILQPSSFGVFRLRWLEHIRANKSAKTANAYSYALNHFLALDDIPLERLTGQALQTVLDSLSGRTRQQCFDKAKQMLGTAIKWGCLHSNPMANLDRPSHDRAAIDPFELAEIASIIQESKHTRYGAAIHLGLSCGLRGGELWGLKWSDLSGGELTIQRQACETSGQLEIKPPKTAAGTRRILLPDSVVDALAVKRADSLRDGHAGIESIFPGENGSTTRRSNFGYRVWAPLLKKLGLRHRGFHHARHTCATLLLNSGSVPLPVVSKLLGHASPAITLGIYSHVMVTDQARHRNAFDSVLRIG
jgi:integrase